jgi:hypothetical protein
MKKIVVLFIAIGSVLLSCDKKSAPASVVTSGGGPGEQVLSPEGPTWGRLDNFIIDYGDSSHVMVTAIFYDTACTTVCHPVFGGTVYMNNTPLPFFPLNTTIGQPNHYRRDFIAASNFTPATWHVIGANSVPEFTCDIQSYMPSLNAVIPDTISRSQNTIFELNLSNSNDGSITIYGNNNNLLAKKIFNGSNSVSVSPNDIKDIQPGDSVQVIVNAGFSFRRRFNVKPFTFTNTREYQKYVLIKQ